MKDIDEKLFPEQGLVGQIKPLVGALKSRFIIEPFSVLNTREDIWKKRRAGWIAMGIQSELGRGEKLTYNIAITAKGQHTSIFDPVLCECVYRWFSAPGWRVLDPFAGGSVRGVVASILGRDYYGIDVREEQIESNRAQAEAGLRGKIAPQWVQGDANDVLHFNRDKVDADLLFTCPPYGNLEVYSDHPDDISRLSYDRFRAAYRAIVKLAVARLRVNSFACIVVANYRDPKTGFLVDFVSDTISAFTDAGCEFYNDAVLLNQIGTGAQRAEGNFIRGSRKLVKLHQNLLVFVKGDPIKTAAAIQADADGSAL
jgi:hypothetical protein